MTLSASVVLVSSACAAPGGDGVTEDGPIAYVTESHEGGDDALLEGTLEVGDACVVVVDAAGRRVLPVLQRPRAAWDGMTLTYVGSRYTEGSGIRLAGGFSDDASAADHVPEGCDYEDLFYAQG